MTKKIQNQKLFILPGYGESITSKGYKELIKIAEKKKLESVFVRIKWEEGKTIFEYIKEIKNIINKKIKKGEEINALGFSFGSYILSQLTKTKIKFRKLYFCSTSPYFKYDISKIPKEAKDYFGKRFMRSVSRYIFPSISKSEAYFLIGRDDWSMAIERTNSSFLSWKGKKRMIIIDKVGHNISDKKYLKTISKLLK